MTGSLQLAPLSRLVLVARLAAAQKKVLEAPGAAARVGEIEDELRLAAGLTALREQAGYSERELAERMGVSQPRVEEQDPACYGRAIRYGVGCPLRC